MRYPDHLALSDLNLRVEPGEIFCLLGANGAGKPTTSNLFLHFLRPDSGRALISGQDVGADPTRFQQANLYLFPVYLIFTDGSFLEWALFPTWQNINFPFAPLGLEIEQQSNYYLTQAVRYNTDRSRQLSASARFDWGGYYNGRRRSVTAGVRYAPSPHLALNADYEYNDLRGVGGDERDLETHLVTGGLRAALNPRLQVSVFYQYNSFDEQRRWNVRASWEYRPLSFVYLVFNENDFAALDRRDRSVIAKMNFMRQF